MVLISLQSDILSRLAFIREFMWVLTFLKMFCWGDRPFSVPLFRLYEAFLDVDQIWQHVSAYNVFSNCNVQKLTQFLCKLNIVPYYFSALHCAPPMSQCWSSWRGRADAMKAWQQGAGCRASCAGPHAARRLDMLALWHPFFKALFRLHTVMMWHE